MHSISGAAAGRRSPHAADAGRRRDALGGEAGAGEPETEQVPGGGQEVGDVEQCVVGDAVAEQRARRGHVNPGSILMVIVLGAAWGRAVPCRNCKAGSTQCKIDQMQTGKVNDPGAG